MLLVPSQRQIQDGDILTWIYLKGSNSKSAREPCPTMINRLPEMAFVVTKQ